MFSGWQVFYALLTVIKPFGLCPISLRRSSNNSVRISSSLLLRIFQYVPFIIILIGSTVYIIDIVSSKSLVGISGSKLTQTQYLLRAFERITVIIPGLFVCYVGTTDGKNLIKVIKSLQRFDLHIKIDKEISFKFITRIMIHIVCVFILMTLETIFWHNPFKKPKELPYSCYRILKICGYLFCIQICVLFKMLVQRFLAINEQLKSLRLLREVWMKEHLFLRRDHLSNELARLSVAHDALCDITDLINQVFGPRLLIVVYFLGIRLTIGIFFGVILTPKILSIALNKGFHTVNRTALAWPWCVLDSFTIIMLAILADSITTEASHTSCILQKINNSSLSPAAKEEIYVFQCKLSSRKINISACGLFDLNNSFLTMIGGGVVSFLLILFQFYVSDIVSS